MKKIFFIVLMLLFASYQNAYAQTLERENNTANVDVVPQPTATELVGENIQIARSLIESGELLKAREHLKKSASLLPEGNRKALLMNELYDLNMRIAFSPLIAENSTLYEVKDGDTLGKIANEFNTTVEFIMKSNNLRNHIIRPKQKLKVCIKPIRIFVDKSDNVLTVFVGDEVLKKYSVATGENNSTPIGAYTIESKLENPTWFHAGAVVPPESPENILGTRWLGISYPGYGIHGTTKPESIGTQATAGCVRMKNAEVEELYSIVPYGTQVEIVD